MKAATDDDIGFALALATVSVGDRDLPAYWWWLSFCDPNLPTGEQFLGACVVKAINSMAAVTAATVTHLNPGGEVAITGPIPDEVLPVQQPRWALMSREEIDAADRLIEKGDDA